MGLISCPLTKLFVLEFPLIGRIMEINPNLPPPLQDRPTTPWTAA